jgi:hypothetical protein
MRSITAALALFALLFVLLAQSVSVAWAQDMTLTLPHPLAAGETAWIELQLGPIGRQEIDITTAAGQPLGTISPFGPRTGQDAGTYAFPVPADLIRDGRLAVRITITPPNGPPRAATEQEVRSVKLTVSGASR